MRKATPIIIIFFMIALAFAQVPRTMDYQGKLTNAFGVAYHGDYSINFRIYDASGGGNLLSEEEILVTVTDGIFDATLDFEIPPRDTLRFDKPYWLEITIDGETLYPRMKLATVGYSFRSIYADTAMYFDGELPEPHWQVIGDDMHPIPAGNVGIGALPEPSAKLDISSDNRGVLIPRMSTAERDAIEDPADALLIHNTTVNCMQVFNLAGSVWEDIHCLSDCRPIISGHPSDVVVCADKEASFTVIATCSEPSFLSFRWQVDEGGGFVDITASGEAPEYADWNTATLSVNSIVAGNDGYLYRCIVSGDRVPPAVSNHALLTVETPPPAPRARQPYPTEILGESFTAHWEEVPGATGYYLDVSASSDFSDFVYGYEFLDVGDELSQEVVGLDEEQRYFYRVYAENDCDISAFSNVIDIYTSDCPLFLSVGDTCGGGVVAHIDYPGCECGLLIVSMEDMTGAADTEWGCHGTLIGGTATGRGTGRNNTALILDGCDEEGIAARLCSEYEGGGFTDWFLPSRTELGDLYSAREAINNGLTANGGTPFATGYYWSSSESDAENAWRRLLTSAVQYSNSKTSTSRVRAVRSFRAVD